jgi:hypothetical protein
MYSQRERVVDSCTCILCAIGYILVISSSIFYCNYYNNKNWNDHSQETSCHILNHTIVSIERNSNMYVYDGYIGVTYNISNNETMTNEINVYENGFDESNVLIYLNENFEIGSNITCYYQTDNPRDLSLTVFQLSLISIMIFCGVGTLCLLIAIFIKYYFSHNPCCSCKWNEYIPPEKHNYSQL